MTTATRRRAWSVPEWRAFMERYWSARDDAADLVASFPETPGVTRGLVNRLIGVHRGMLAAAVGLENVIVGQHPGLDGEVIRFVHGEGLTMLLPCRGRVPARAPHLTREQWLAFGDRIKALRAAILGLANELQSTRGGTKPVIRPLIRVGEMGKLRSRLDGIVCDQHPDWHEAAGVFYGPSLD
jgi:hypothetical protein